MQTPPEISAVIVTWNSFHWITACLETLIQDFKAIPNEVILVDNASTDGTVTLVRERFPEVRLVQNSENVGFGRACNQGLALCHGEYILFQNPDTKIIPGAIPILLEFMRQYQKAGAVGPILLNSDGSLQLIGKSAPSLKNLFFETSFFDRLALRKALREALRRAQKIQTDSLEVDWTMGACLMMRKSALDQVGAFDEKFFLFFEETDLCLRLKQAGYGIFVVPQARVIHLGGGAAHYTARKIIEYHKSIFYFAGKHFSVWQKRGLTILILLRTAIRMMMWTAFLPLMKTNSVEKLRGYKGVLKLCIMRWRIGVKNWLMRTFPKSLLLPALYYYKNMMGQLDQELLMLKKMLGHCKCAIDIGANVGLYSYALSKFCDRVETFEPNPDCAEVIFAYNARNIRVHKAGLSSKSGFMTLHIPIHDGRPVTGFASFEDRVGDQRHITVPVSRLDDYNFKNVSFIKIDVEGHEDEVLEGARQTILREKPILLIEIEQRHAAKPIELVFDHIIKLGYTGYFMQNGELRPISVFSYKVHQEPFLQNVMNKNYVNDFIFKPCP